MCIRDSHTITLVPNLNDPPLQHPGAYVVNPRSELWSVLQAIYSSEIIVSSSLHGFIMAEAFNRPARLVASGSEPPFKYEDYFLGTGRNEAVFHGSVQEALSAPDHPPAVFDSTAMINAFPVDLFSNTDV